MHTAHNQQHNLVCAVVMLLDPAVVLLCNERSNCTFYHELGLTDSSSASTCTDSCRNDIKTTRCSGHLGVAEVYTEIATVCQL